MPPRIETSPCPVDEINRDLTRLVKGSKEEAVRDGRPLFERLIEWISTVDPKKEEDKFHLATILIFSIASKLFEKEAIDGGEKKRMYERAIQVISRNSDVIATLREFLKQREQELIEK